MRRWSMLSLRRFLIGLTLMGVIVIPSVVHAQATTFSVESVGSQVGLGSADLRQTIINVIRWALGFITLAAVGYMIYGGVLWMTSRGDAKQVEKAKRVILQAGIGLVIVLLAWAIVLFVVRTATNTTHNPPGSGGPGTGCSGLGCIGAQSDFNVIGIASCAARPEYDQNVPRSSSIAITFNSRVDATSAKAAVTDTTAAPNLQVEKCSTPPDCSSGICVPAASCAGWSTPRPIDSQVFTSGTKPAGIAGSTNAEWVANRNTLTFYHLSFSDDPTNADNRWFESNTTYRVAIPKDTASTALKDLRSRLLKRCEQAPFTPIEGGSCDDSAPDVMYWTFTTGNDTNGPALQVSKTAPTSAYLSGTGTPDRDISRKPVLSIAFDNAIDANSLDTSNFQVFKFTSAPDATTGQGGTLSGTPVPATQFDLDYTSNGAVMTLVNGNLLEPFTWYKVVVKDVRNLCSTLQQQNPYEWVFETNDAVPGRKMVYPTNDNACPATEVFIQFATPMWKPGSFDCQVGTPGTYVKTGTLAPNSGRVFSVVNNFDPSDPNHSCTKYAFGPTSTLLAANTNYTANVTTDLQIDQSGTKLSKSWSFKTATADSCIQEPYIERISPTHASAGACISVIGNYFEKKLVGSSTRETDGQNTGDKVVINATDQPVKNWTNRAIVSAPLNGSGLTAGPNQKYKVTVAYPAPIGALESNEETFTLDPGTGGSGPCLTDLNPTDGNVGISVDAKGENLGTGGGASKVTFTNGLAADWDISGINWSDTSVEGAKVTPASQVGSGIVHLTRSDGAVSNDLPFEVTVPAAGAPKVVEDTQCDESNGVIPTPNPKRGDTKACTNSQITARFTVPMDSASIEAANNIILEKCNPTCSPVPSSVAFLPDRAFALTPNASLAQGTQYKVTITTNVKSAAGQPLSAPYSWTFTTATGANCQVQALSCSSGVVQGTAIQSTTTSYTFQNTPYGIGLNALALGPECRTIDNSSVNFAWSMNPDPNSVITLGSPSGSSNVALNFDPAVPGTASTKATAQGKSCKAVSVTYDPTVCKTNNDCATNKFGEACTANGTPSTCQAGRCTPVVTGIEADNGPVGEWVTVKGCWFGGFDTTKSRVIFRGNVGDNTDDHDGRSPDPLVCGSPAATWTNERIVREVPNIQTLQTSDDAKTGPVRVNRFDDLTADGPTFTVNTNALTPGICKINPGSGLPGASTTISGARFSNTQDAGDEANIRKVLSSTTNQLSVLSSGWADTSINAQIPLSAEIGGSEIRIKNAGQTSNPWPHTVKDPSSATASCTTKICAADSNCTGTGADGTALSPTGFGCAKDFCCRPRPKLVAGSPTGTNACRNSLVTATFDQPLDGTSVTDQTVWYLDGARVANGSMSVRNDDTSGTIEYQPGLLQPSTDQKLYLTNQAETPLSLVQNPSFEIVGTGNLPANWNSTNGISRSTDHAPGVSGVSALVDCGGNCPDAQRFTLQDLTGTNVAGRTFRITAWVKVETTGTLWGGLIGQCAKNGSPLFDDCGYDTGTANPAFFRGSSGGWKHVEFQVTQLAGFTDQLRLTCFANKGVKTWCDDISITELSTGGTSIRGKNGVVANVTTSPVTSPIRFTTGADICRINQVVVSPSFQRFTTVPQNAFYFAYAVGPHGEYLYNIPGIYSWTWDWKSGNDAVATVNGSTAANSTSTATVTSKANGTTAITATAKVTQDSSGGRVPQDYTGQGQVNVEVCDVPWQVGATTGFADGASNCSAGGTCNDYHFGLYYCRGQATQTQLPNFGYTAIEGDRNDGSGRVKSFFFKESAASRDTIGMLIYKNDASLSPADWYQQRFPLDTGASSTIIAGYPAVKTGTTAYIGVTDVNGSSTRGLIFVIDFNSNNASGDTKNIYNRILNSITFNTNITNPVQKQQLVNDTRRRQDLSSIKLLFDAYKQEHGSYPSLSGGTYLLGMSASTWPSWQQTLGNTLGKTLPNDPLNAYSPACEAPNVPANRGYDKNTCWSEPDKQFRCPANSHIYAVRVNGTTLSLYANMEYSGAGHMDNRNPATNFCNDLNGSVCSCFNYQLP